MSKKMLLTMLVCLVALAVAPFTVYGADKLIVQNSGGTAVMTASDSGTIMLNTATWDGPTWAKVYGAADAAIAGVSMDSYAAASDKGGGGQFRFARGTQAAKAAVQNGDRLGFFVFGAYDGSAFYNSAAMTAKIDGAVSTGVVPTKLAFETGTNLAGRAERMVISSAGYVGIGNTSPGHLLVVGNSGAYSDGGAWVDGSSRSYKDNIETLSAKKAIDTVKNLTPVTYVYKTNPDQGHVGFIAEDVPSLVATNDRKGLSPMDIVAVLTKVVQEQDKTIESLSATVSRLESEINKLKK
jgi:hypothetical protein